MSTKTLFVGLPLILSMTACGSAVSPAETDAGAEQTDAAASVDAGTVDGPVADAAPPAPMIDEAFGSCTNPGPAGGLAGGDQLMRLDVDTGTFPNAVCNDGTPAVYYVRRATNPAHVDKWVLQLQGGGACSSPELCAQRWCSVSTNFGARKMSSSFAPERGINGRGVLANQADNPFNGWNHVFVYYCSSDSWSGTKGETTIEATHPVTGGAATSYRMHFNGAHIVESVVRTLRREAGNVTYEDAAMNTREMPDLDDAATVVFAGASAGGGGIVNNLDWLNEHLTANNNDCAGGSCSLEVAGIVDSSFPVDLRSLGFANTTMCTSNGVCSADALNLYRWTEVNTALWQSRGDQSCRDWHDSSSTGITHWCADKVFVMENHLTTPFIVRMGLTDSLVSGNMVDAGYTVPSQGNAALSVPLFAQLVAAQLNALPSAVASGNEAGAVTKLPGVFGPRCSGHETLSNSAYFDATVADLSFPQLIANWYTETGTVVAVSSDPADAASCN